MNLSLVIRHIRLIKIEKILYSSKQNPTEIKKKDQFPFHYTDKNNQWVERTFATHSTSDVMQSSPDYV